MERLTRKLYPPGVTPLPTLISTVTLLTVITNGMAMTSPFSYLPKMMVYFDIKEVDIGWHVGMISACMYLARVPSSLLWGIAADRIGKKYSSIISAVCLAVTTIAFGFSSNIYYAAAYRCAQGTVFWSDGYDEGGAMGSL